MKKKYLKSLLALEKWLTKEAGESSELETAFQVIRQKLQALPEEQETTEDGLPLPKEIAEEPHTIALYSDGGCRGNPGPGAYAFVIQTHEGKILAEGVDFDSLTTNNKMELLGPLRGLRDLHAILPNQGQDPRLTKVKVMTDSKYVVDGMKSWVQGWKARGWKKADNKAPENLELWQALDQIRQEFMQVEWLWIKGHAGHPQNEYCDRKANEMMDENLN